MNAIWSIAIKDIRLLLRDKLGLFWVLGFPLIFGSFFGAIMSGGGEKVKMKFAILDEDQSDSSQKLRERLCAADSLEIVSAESEQEARNQVRRGKLIAYLVIKKGFGDSQLFFMGQSAGIRLGVDPSRQAEKGMIEGLVLQAAYAGMGDQFANPKKMLSQIDKSIADLKADKDASFLQKQLLVTFLGQLSHFLGTMEPATLASGMKMGGVGVEVADVRDNPAASAPATARRNAYAVSFPSAILWGVLGCAAGFAISLVKERTAGTLLRLRLAPITHTHVLAGKGMACFLACCGSIVLVLLMGMLVFKIRITDPVKFSVAVVATSLCFTGIMMLMSVIGRTEAAVAGAGWGCNIIFAMLGGGMVPLVAMPRWMYEMGSVSPVKWSILALEGAIWRQYTWGELAYPVGILLAIALLGFTVGTLMFKRMDD